LDAIVNSSPLVRLPVSVIIPAYRASATLPRAIVSVAAQTQWPQEIIVVDDASGDDTVATAQTLAAHHPGGWIRIIVQPNNQGAGHARNVGWAAAQGEYIAFLDADDTWHPKKLEIQYAYMQAHTEVDLCGHRHATHTPTAAVSLEPQSHDFATPCQGQPIDRLGMLMKNPFITPSVMLRRKLTQRFREGQRYMEDHALWMQILLEGGRVTWLDATLATIHKPAYGMSGLSSHMWAMEKAELYNYVVLVKKNCLNPIVGSMLMLFSLAKFIRRTLIWLAR
jgi:glycosyltransferase involved in cell wall biosynthesis